MLTKVHDEESSSKNVGVGRCSKEIVRDGARQMLAAALEAEIAAYIEQFADQVDENRRRPMVRNGCHHKQDVPTAAEVYAASGEGQRPACRSGFR